MESGDFLPVVQGDITNVPLLLTNHLTKEDSPSEGGDEDVHIPPCYRFCPEDHELLSEYLINKILERPLPYNKINNVNLYDHNPDELTQYEAWEENEWYFFTPRDRKYPNGRRPDRAAKDGFWRASTGREVIHKREKLGDRMTLEFHQGEQRNRKKTKTKTKTDWRMHEYVVDETILKNHPRTENPLRNEGSKRLDDFVLCRVYMNGGGRDKSAKTLKDKSTKKGKRDKSSRTKTSEVVEHVSVNDNLEQVGFTSGTTRIAETPVASEPRHSPSEQRDEPIMGLNNTSSDHTTDALHYNFEEEFSLNSNFYMDYDEYMKILNEEMISSRSPSGTFNQGDNVVAIQENYNGTCIKEDYLEEISSDYTGASITFAPSTPSLEPIVGFSITPSDYTKLLNEEPHYTFDALLNANPISFQPPNRICMQQDYTMWPQENYNRMCIQEDYTMANEGDGTLLDILNWIEKIKAQQAVQGELNGNADNSDLVLETSIGHNPLAEVHPAPQLHSVPTKRQRMN
ncbi:uncharacterized protein LOC143891752 [Tasmannia lanceolata]|uniref:uncharacterized protein LOC143891752 n=1 Tax=Tasmannia lanceolata TaxID=3420 RepID=UPI0040638545